MNQDYLKKALEQVGEAVIITDIEGNITFCNQYFSIMSGYSINEVIGQRPSFWNSGLQSEEFYLKLWNEILSGKIWRGEIINKKKDGTLIDCDLVITPLRDEQGKIEGFIATSNDITQQKSLQRELEESNQALKKLENQKQKLLSYICHDFKTPLNSLLMGVEQINEVNQGPNKKTIEIIKNSATYLGELIENLSWISHGGNRELKEKPIKCNLNHFFEEITNIVNKQIELKGNKLIVQNNLQNEDILIRKKALKRIILNLIGNANKFTNFGTITMSVIKTRLNLSIIIEDTGIGIEEKKLAKIFRPFEQAHENISKKYGGNGLGLSITKQLTKRLGGKIFVTSQVNEGSIFQVKIPLEVESLKEKSFQKEIKNNYQENNILIIDDDQDFTHMFQLMGKNLSQNVFCAKNFQDAIEIISKNELDILVIDGSLENESGIEVALKIKSKFKNIKSSILGLTGNSSPEFRDIWLSHGFDEVYLKPINRKILESLLSNWGKGKKNKKQAA